DLPPGDVALFVRRGPAAPLRIRPDRADGQEMWRHGVAVQPTAGVADAGSAGPLKIVARIAKEDRSQGEQQAVALFRGHEWIKPFLMCEGETVSFKRHAGAAPIIKVNGSSKERVFLFILDCSESMSKKEKPKEGLESRMDFAKKALNSII